MIRLRLVALLLAAALAPVLAGCGDRQPLQEPVSTIDGPYRLDTGDRLRVVVYDQPNLTNLYEVDQAGYVLLPLIGGVAARGGSTDQVASRIAAKLATNFIRDPDVTVEVAEYRPFFALGEVGNPGQYPYVPGMTAETAIAVAGGFSDRANKRIVRISRSLGGKLHEGKIAVTEPIRPGDTIYVFEGLF